MRNPNIVNFSQFTTHLQSAPHLKKIQEFIPTITADKLRQIIAELLKREDDDVENPNQDWLGMQKSWDIVAPENRSDEVAKTEQLFRQYLSDLSQRKITIPNIEPRIQAFFGVYANKFLNEAQFPVLMQLFCQYVILMDRNSPSKIKDCLVEFPPSNAYLQCLPGTMGRLQQQIRNLLLPRELQLVLEAGMLSVQYLVETVKSDVKLGNETHIPYSLEYALGIKPEKKIKDRFYTIPRTELKLGKMLQANYDFAVKFREFLWESYHQYYGAIALFQEFCDIDKIVKDAGCEDGLYDGYDHLSVEQKAEIKKDAEEKLQDLNERLKDLGIMGGFDGLCEIVVDNDGDEDDITTWKWNEIASLLIELQIKEFNNVLEVFFNLEMSRLPENMQPAEDVGRDSKYTLDKITPESLVQDLLVNKDTAVDAFWMMGYFENQKTSHINFVFTFYQLGKSFYENEQDKTGLNPQNHWENAKICLKQIKGNLPSNQQFRIDDIIGFIDSQRFKYPKILASETNPELGISHKKMPKSLLKNAIIYGATSIVARYIAENINLKIKRVDHFDLPIHYAVRCRQAEVVRVLLDNGVDLNGRNSEAKTPLMIACKSGDLDLFKILLPNSDLTVLDDKGNSLLHFAIDGRNSDIVQTLLDMGVDLNHINSIGQTPLMIACKNGHLDIFNRLLPNSNLAAVDIRSNNSLHYAVAIGNGNIVKKILEMKVIDANGKNIKGQTPLMVACESGNLDIFNILLSNSNLTLVDNSDNNILCCAINGGNGNIVKKILEMKVIDANGKNIKGKTPLMIACGNGNLDIFNMLLSVSNPAEVDNNGNNMLHYVGVGKNKDILQQLLKMNLDVNSRNAEGQTPLMIACENGGWDVCDILLQNSNLTAVDSKGNNILYYAVSGGNKNVVQALLDISADMLSHPTIKLILAAACENSDIEIVEIILGKVQTMPDDYLSGVLAIALKNRNVRIASMILDTVARVYSEEMKLAFYEKLSKHFEKACKIGDQIIAKMILEKIQEVNRADADLINNGLLIAIGEKHLNLAQQLINDGADVNRSLSLSIACRHLNIAQELIRYGADVNRVSFDPILDNLNDKNGSLKIFEFLLENDLSVDRAIEFVNHILSDSTFLSENFMRMLFVELQERGVSIETDELQNLIVNYFILSLENSRPIDLSILDYLSDVNRQMEYNEEGSEMGEEEQINIAYMAALHGNSNVIKELIEQSANFDIQNPKDGFTPLMVAIAFASEDPEPAMLLVPKSDLSIKNNKGQSALFMAAAMGNVDIVKKLLVNGACINDCIENGTVIANVVHVGVRAVLEKTFELFSVAEVSSERVKSLLTEGAISGAKNEQNQTPRQVAEIRNPENQEIINILKKAEGEEKPVGISMRTASRVASDENLQHRV